jgi:hypothetical protein
MGAAVTSCDGLLRQIPKAQAPRLHFGFLMENGFASLFYTIDLHEKASDLETFGRLRFYSLKGSVPSLSICR